MSQLFTINSTDFTPFITVPSYKVNEFDISDDWEDGNKRKHKYIVRTQVKGSFTMKFQKSTDFNNFFSVIDTNKVTSGEYSGACLASVYVQNKNTVKSVYVYISADPADSLPVLGTADDEGFEVTIEEV